jgi:hypothetical protein
MHHANALRGRRSLAQTVHPRLPHVVEVHRRAGFVLALGHWCSPERQAAKNPVCPQGPPAAWWQEITGERYPADTQPRPPRNRPQMAVGASGSMISCACGRRLFFAWGDKREPVAASDRRTSGGRNDCLAAYPGRRLTPPTQTAVGGALRMKRSGTTQINTSERRHDSD